MIKMTLPIVVMLGMTAPLTLAHDGMKFEPPDGKAYSGIGNDKKEADAFEAITAPFFRTSHEKLYSHWDLPGASHPFNPTKLLNNLNLIAADGQIPHVGWTFYGFDPLSFLPIDVEILNGSYDAYITSFANVIKQFGKPIFIGPGVEFNFSGYTPGVFPHAYRYIVDKFRDMDVDNVAWLWNPLVEHTAVSQFDDVMPNGDPAWWPGDEYVDGTSANVFVAHAWIAGSTTPNALDLKRLLDWSEAHNKPMYNSETTGLLGINNLDTSDPLAQTQANYEWANHFKHMFDYLESHDRAKGFIYISRDWTPFPSWGPAWGNQVIQQNVHLLIMFVLRLWNGKYLNAGETTPAPWTSHQIDKPSPGDTVTVDIHNLPPSAPAALLISAAKLPQGVPVAGVPHGKFWLANPTFLFIVPSGPTGSISISGALPNNPILSGFSIYTQWVSAQGVPAPMRLAIQ